MNQYVNKRFSQ
jgi:Ras-related protein Rab-7A